MPLVMEVIFRHRLVPSVCNSKQVSAQYLLLGFRSNVSATSTVTAALFPLKFGERKRTFESFYDIHRECIVFALSK